MLGLVAALLILGLACSKKETPPKETAPKPAQPVAADPVALDILAKSAAAYQGLSSYKDEILIITNGGGALPRQGSGRTSFQKGGRFLFEVKAKDPYGPGMTTDTVTLRNGKAYLRMSTVSDTEEERTLENALSTIVPTSAHSSMIVPSLLIPDAFAGGGFYDKMVSPRYAGEMKLGNSSCYRITDSNGFGVLIDKTTLLIKRVFLPRREGTLDYNAIPDANLGELDWR